MNMHRCQMRCTLVSLPLVAALVVLAACAAPATHTVPLPDGWDLANAAAGAPASSETVYVAPPTGETTADRASILAALERVRPGGTVQFAPGTYVVGEFVTVAVPRITLMGHREGTTLRGCDPGGFVEMAVAADECNVFSLTGGHQTVRGFTFEHAWHALSLGGLRCEDGQCMPGHPPVEERAGGYLVEGNTFRASQNGIRVSGQWAEPAVIRDNRFIDTYHAVMINGMTAHILDNDITVPEPDHVPYTHHPGLALLISGWEEQEAPACDGNVISGNRISGHPDAIAILVFPGGTCRWNEIRDNTVEMSLVRFASPSTAIYVRSAADSTIAGVPLALLNGVFGEGIIEDNLVEGNRIIGAEGLAIEIVGSSRNRIANNTITGVVPRDSFPGNTLFPDTPMWAAANGAAIWVSPGSDANEIIGNAFEDVASHAVFLEGDNNRVERTEPTDAVRDLGTGNRVSGPDTTASSPSSKSRFIDAGGVGLHYLDFGGEGLPILFTAGSRSAETWAGFAPRFTDGYRVLAVTDRGVPPSEGEASGFARRAGDILRLLDTLGIERVVLVANSNPAQILIYLAEHHPERLAGLVFLAPDSEAGLDSVEDPSGAMLMVERALLSAQDRVPDEAGNWDEEDLYGPRYLAGDTATIAVPALTFVNLEGTRGLERSYYPLEVADLVASGALVIPDSAARTYFERLAGDEAMQAEVRAGWDGTFVPVFRANEQAFFRAFGDHLRLVRLDVPLMNGVPVVTGYEYLTAPELIEPHIRRFLEEVDAREQRRPTSSTDR